jgi:hypothetical protein
MIFEVLGYYNLLIDTYFIMKNSCPNLTISRNSNALLNSFKKQFFFVFAFFALTTQSFGQGTTCSNATTLTVNGVCSTNVNPSGSDSTPVFSNCGGGGNSNDIGWFKFVVSSGPLNITISAVGDRNLAFQLIGSTTNNCSNLSEIQCVNDQGGSQNNNSTETTTTLLANGTYYIKVLSTGGGTMTLSSLCVTGASSNCHPLTYCNTTYPSSVYPITNVNFAGINNSTSNTINGTPDQEIFCSTGNLTTGTSYTISVNGNTGGSNVFGVMAYFDWNHETYTVGVLNDNSGSGIPATTNISIPYGIPTGITTMRIISKFSAYAVSCNTLVATAKPKII